MKPLLALFLGAAALAAELGEWFRANYRKAEAMAKQYPKL